MSDEDQLANHKSDLFDQMVQMYNEEKEKPNLWTLDRWLGFASDVLITYLPLVVYILISRDGFYEVFRSVSDGEVRDTILINSTISNLWLNISYIYFSQFRRTSFNDSVGSFFLSCLKLFLGVIAIVFFTTDISLLWLPIVSIIVSLGTLYFTVHNKSNSL